MNKIGEKFLVKLTIGDWSNDGHGKYQEYSYLVNYPTSKIQEAYKASVEKTGIAFDDEEGKKSVFTGYEDCYLDKKAIGIFKELGILYAHDELDKKREDTTTYWSPDEVASLIMRFISLSMPSDFQYALLTPEPINGWWCEGLNDTFGYGLFD